MPNYRAKTVTFGEGDCFGVDIISAQSINIQLMMKLTSDFQETLTYNYEVTHIFLHITLKIILTCM